MTQSRRDPPDASPASPARPAAASPPASTAEAAAGAATTAGSAAASASQASSPGAAIGAVGTGVGAAGTIAGATGAPAPVTQAASTTASVASGVASTSQALGAAAPTSGASGSGARAPSSAQGAASPAGAAGSAAPSAPRSSAAPASPAGAARGAAAAVSGAAPAAGALAGSAPNVFSLLQGESGQHGVAYRFHSEGAPSGCWRVRRAALREGLSENYKVQLELGSNAGDDATALLGHPCTLTLLRDDAERAVQGIVSRVSRGDLLRDMEVIEVEVVPALEALAHRTDIRIFQDKTIPEVLDEVLAPALAPYQRKHEKRLQRSVYPKREYIVQHRESDLAFVRRLMADEGIWYHFEHPSGEGKPELLVLCDTNDVAKNAELGDAGRRLNLALGRKGSLDREAVNRFVRADLFGPTSVTVREYNWTAPDAPELKAYPSEDLGDRPLYEPHDLTMWGYGDPRFSKFDTADQARLRWERRDASHVQARGTSNVTGLTPGTVVQVQGHPSGLNGEWLILTVEAKGSYMQEGAAAEDYANAFTCIPKSTAYRPKREPKPRVFGIQTGVVVGADGKPEIPANGDDIHTDSHGRIQVKLTWDRTPPGEATATESCFLRVAQGWAGVRWGIMFIPRIGMEVIVNFIDGDPDRPLVTGCVYNGKNRPHYELPGEKTKSYIMTQSTPNGGGSNELRFEDAKGSEEIFVHAQKDYNEVVENNHATTVKANQTDSVRGSQSVSVGGDRSKTVRGNETNTVEKKRTTTVHGDEMLKVVDGANRVVEVSGTETMTITGATEETYTGGRTATVKTQDALNVVGANKSDHVTGSYTIKTDTSVKIHKGENALLLNELMSASFTEHIELKVGANTLRIGSDGKISLHAEQEISLTCGGASITLAASGTIDAHGSVKACIGSGASSVTTEGAGVTLSGPKIASSAIGIHEIGGALIKIG